MKYPRASGALRWDPDPTLKRAHFTRTMLLCTIGNLGLSRSGPPPDQILDPPLGVEQHHTSSETTFQLSTMEEEYIGRDPGSATSTHCLSTSHPYTLVPILSFSLCVFTIKWPCWRLAPPTGNPGSALETAS